jgi:hypothetical protein
MSFSKFRLPPSQPNLEFVTVIADEGDVRVVARIARDIIEDAFPDEKYHRDRLAVVGRNFGLLGPIIQAKFEAGDYTEYADSLGVRSGKDKLIIIDRNDLADRMLQ